MTISPGYAQADAFSAGDSGTRTCAAKDYYVEWPSTTSFGDMFTAGDAGVQRPRTSTGASKLSVDNHNVRQPALAQQVQVSLSIADPFAYSQMPYQESGGDAFSIADSFTTTKGTITGSETQTTDTGKAPRLEGATNGTIGDLAEQEYEGPVKIIFYKRNPTVPKVARALRELDVPRSFSIRQMPTDLPIRGSLSVKNILQVAATIETQSSIRVLQYKVFARKKIHKRNIKQSVLWAEVYYEESPASRLAVLYSRAAQLEKSPVKRHIFLGKAACYRDQRDEAWRQFEQVFKLAKDDLSITQEVENIYRNISGRDLELCIWLTRYLRIAPNWMSFEEAYNERGRIETAWYDEKLKHERGPNITWNSRRMPLKVYFPDNKDEDYDQRLKIVFQDCMSQWIEATGGKIDFIETNDEKTADITFGWQNPENRYQQYDGSLNLPKGEPTPERVGDTRVESQPVQSGKSELVRASVRIYANQGSSMRTVSDDYLKVACLHELGHVLGIMKHLHNKGNVMFPYIDQDHPTTMELTLDDKNIVSSLYESHPVNLKAVEKFIGLRATCKKLDLASGTTKLEQVQN